MPARRHLLPWLLALGLTSASAMAGTSIELGQQIYLRGELPDGSPLQGRQPNGELLSGAEAACVRCHRGSGLGGVEGKTAVPPINGQALFSAAAAPVVKQDIRYNPGLSERHAPYTLESFSLALREGIHVSGRSMAAPMPRFQLSDRQTAALADYLNTLSAHWSAGTDADAVEVATVITPDVTPPRRQALLATLHAVLGQMNANVGLSQRQKISNVDRQQHVRRKVLLSVWELQGASETWAQQLDTLQRDKPVFALVSGTSERSPWEPVQAFCERQHVVCWLPSVGAVPAGADHASYSVYFSAGMALDAQVISSALRNRPGKVWQLVGNDPLASSGASLLTELLAVAEAPMDRPDSDGALEKHLQTRLQQRLEQCRQGDTLVLWLNRQELQRLPRASRSACTLFISATIAGEDMAVLPPALRINSRLVQQQELPELRQLNLQRFDAWAQGSKVELVDPRLQSEAYFAGRSFVYVLRSMLNNLYTDYYIEKAESAVSMFESMQVQDEIQSMMMAPMMKRAPVQTASQPVPGDNQSVSARQLQQQQEQQHHLDAMRQRGGTTVYPRLGLGAGQRFASKGAYLLPLDREGKILADRAEWVVP